MRSNLPLHRLITTIAVAAVVLTGCNSDSASQAPDTLVSVGRHSLTLRDLRSSLPPGLTPEDSALYAKAYIRRWIDNRLLSDVASDQVDMTEINRMVEEYRQELIMASYRRSMARRADDTLFSDDSLLAYYQEHKKEFILERPLVKGIYIKVPDDADNLRELRRLYRSDRPGDMDKLEKTASGTAIHYDYFRDRWIDWEQIEKRIPGAPSENPDSYLRAHRSLDIKQDGFVYLLSITDILPAGTAMPYEVARPLVIDNMLTQLRRRYDARLRNDLFDQSLRDGTIRFPGSNPLE